MYLDSIAFTRAIPCLAEPGKIIVYGRPSRPINEVIPYLAALPGVIAYNPGGCTVTFRRQAGFMTLYADKVFITKVANVDEGLGLLAALHEAINATWEHRDELVAATAVRRAPRHLDVYSLLPQTNCRKCGEATCLAFAVLLIQQKRLLSECLPMQQDPSFTDQKATLEAML